MLKYLLLALVVIWLFYSPALRGRRQVKREPPSAPQPPPPAPTQAMVSCAHCGVHLPESDAVVDGHGQTYCGNAHRQAGPANH